MTVEGFNNKYKQYLVEGHYGLDINNPNVIKILDSIFDKYLTKIEGFKYYQIKVKFGTPIFYSSLDDGFIEGALIVDLIESLIATYLTLDGTIK